MTGRKYLKYLLLSLALVSLIFGGLNQTRPSAAMPMSPVDETKVPHYFGPYPNWANSPFTLPDATVQITGDGAGAAAVATVGANGAITGITVTNPGIGYTAATVDILSGAGINATATATVATNGIVTSITVDTPGAGYTAPVVTLLGGGGLGGLRNVGNQLLDRAFASEEAGNVFVVLPEALPDGFLQSIVTRNQAGAGGAASAGQSFNAYVLQPTGKANEFTVVFDSGLLTVPALADSKKGEFFNFPLKGVSVQAGDLLAFYGRGIPVDVGAGADLSMVAASAPAQDSTITLGSAEFLFTGQPRTYSFAANILEGAGRSGIDTDGVPEAVATATAYGGVDALVLDTPGIGYSIPTVDFDSPNDPNGSQAQGHATFDPVTGAITGVFMDFAGSGYTAAPGVTIRDGTIWDPVLPGGSGATAHATLFIGEIRVDNPGSGYIAAPTVDIADPTGTGAAATAFVSAGGITGITVTNPGSGYLTQGGIKKFQDGLPVLCIPTANFSECAGVANNLGQYIPIAVPDTTTFTIANGFAADADYYVIALIQHRERMSSSLPATGSLLRGYVQLETPANASFSKHIPLQNALVDGTTVPALMPDGSQAYAVDEPHYLGPVIVANKNRPVRLLFYNLLPAGSGGDLFLPGDTSIMGSGMGPMDMMPPVDAGSVTDEVRNPVCTDNPQAIDPMTGEYVCFKQNRSTVHLHGGTSPWISDGTAHQWITPATENTPWPEGVAVESVPDMARPDLGVPDCSGVADGCMTFYYTNQQSARLMFYHDHMWGMTRLNVYAGVAAGYVIVDETEQKLFGPTGIYANMGEGIPLVIQEKTFIPQGDAATRSGQLYESDPTWDESLWGSYGNLWYHHVYMSAQNPGDPGGMSAYGRWMYGPWFWPPATPLHGPIANPYYDMDPEGPDGIRGTPDDFTTPLGGTCVLDNPATWQYDTEPFCEPQLIPGTPLISAGMEQFNDTPLVNGTAYPTVTLDPQSYRFRILNAANDRVWNLQWYIADPTTGTDSEVALNPAEVAAAQLDPTIFPTALQSIMFNGAPYNLAGPDWIAIGSEGGFLPAPVVVDGQQVTTWITDPTRFDVGTVDKHSLLLSPAERADVVVDFSAFAGQTLILYNDAPAAFPARIPSYDYYTGAPDLSPVGAPRILPGYGPNTRTIMQVKINAITPAAPFNFNTLYDAFKHHADGSGVFESGQHPIIVGQAAYNSAYGTSFSASAWCNAPGAPLQRCDGFARISDQGGMDFGFNTLRSPKARVTVPLQPKGIHDEMNAVAFDEFGRMTANIGLEVVPATPGNQNIVMYPFINPPTELIDATNLPKLDAAGLGMTPIATGIDGTQIWKITHNGVDTHPIHWHMYDVQIINRVTWDNIVIPNDPTELGWKDTVRISPLQDTIVALRPIIPYVPFELPNSIRLLNPMMPAGSTAMFNNMDANGIPTDPIVNQLVNFGWEFTYHCHILSHEEMDMMRPVAVALPPIAPDGLAWSVAGGGNNTILTLTWNDNSINETSFVMQKSSDGGATWADVATSPSPLDQPNTHGVRSLDDTTFQWNNTVYVYRVVALNTLGYGGQYMSLTVQSASPFIAVLRAPTGLAASIAAGPRVALSWMDNALNESGFIVQRSTDGVNFTQIGTALSRPNTGIMTYSDAMVTFGTTYYYRVAATSPTGSSAFSNVAIITVDIPLAPANLVAVAVNQGNNERVTLTWEDNSNNEANFVIERALDSAFTNPVVVTVPANSTTYTTGNIPKVDYYFRIAAVNVLGQSNWVDATPFPVPPAP
ncbi:MAG: hypothetical protein A2136_07580 [Chloroflexi bacterium RBG_16_54_11]|nr:MAG: hypothetical protein A2136_07580 [Chloroflexi bacterium RBG_16_54_11]